MASSLTLDSSRTWPRKGDSETLYTSNHFGEFSSAVAVMKMMPNMMKPFMTQQLKISVILPSFVRALLWCIDVMFFLWVFFRELSATAPFLVAPHRDSRERHLPRRLTQLRYASDYMGIGQTAQVDAKTNFRFGNIVPKQWTLSGFLQHTSANSMYKNDNNTSQQLNLLYMNKNAATCDTFSNEFFRWNPTTVLMAEGPVVYTTVHQSMVYFRYFRA